MMLLEMASAGFADRVAVTDGRSSLTYGQLFAAAGVAARRIQESGAKHLALLDTSSPAVPVALFASAWAGVPFVPLNYRLTGEELERLTSQISPALLVTDAERAAQFSGPGGLDGIDVIERETFLSQAASGESLDASSWPMDPDDIAILLFTSGTTGPPKAAVIRHKHLSSYIFTTVEFGLAAEEDAQLVCVPPYHIAGMATLCSSIYAGRRIVQLPNFTADEWLRLAHSEQVTNAFVVPTMLARIVEELGAGGVAELPSLRNLAYGGGKMPLQVIEQAMQAVPNADFTQAYGLTETSSTIAVLGPDEHRSARASDDPVVRKRLASVGRPIPSVTVQIRDVAGNVLGANQPGEIYVSGEQVSGEYLGKGSLLDEDGFFPTRDGGYLDDEGYLFLAGRQDDIIVRGGENMSPGEIEDVLLEHPAVRDVAVVGVPDAQWGEAVAAVIVLHDGQRAEAAELQDFVKQRLRSSRSPSQIVFREELPYNETGKLLRRVVRADLAGAES
jgi:acyl-CoA synthetase (AMP-forming)/AMP-acid ligase II